MKNLVYLARAAFVVAIWQGLIVVIGFFVGIQYHLHPGHHTVGFKQGYHIIFFGQWWGMIVVAAFAVFFGLVILTWFLFSSDSDAAMALIQRRERIRREEREMKKAAA